ncbi:MAG: hypothetical protein AB7J28_16805 [Hyphomonadaceae bacterium]
MAEIVEALKGENTRLRVALYRTAIFYGFMVEETRRDVAKNLGLRHDYNTSDLIEAARRDGFDPRVLWPWITESRHAA